jgi:hypothetical protein
MPTPLVYMLAAARAAALNHEPRRIGAGRRTLGTLHREIRRSAMRRLNRRISGRFVWP